jgi:hypothetical protein
MTENSVAIVRYVKRNKSAPHLAVLTPCILTVFSHVN